MGIGYRLRCLILSLLELIENYSGNGLGKYWEWNGNRLGIGNRGRTKQTILYIYNMIGFFFIFRA